jgi:ComF family protein
MNLFNTFIDLIYPPRCPICHAFSGLPLCQPCLDSLSVITSPLCPICGRPFTSGIEGDHVCEDCLRKRPFFDKAAAPYLYEGDLMTAIHEFKYGGKAYMVSALGPLLASFAREWLKERDDLTLMPVPLHPKRLRERGFNQSLLLARHVAPRLNAKLDFLTLRRTRYTKPQTGLKRGERRKNVRRAFELRDPKALREKVIVLVDDVATTGSTLNECARVLKKSGCKEVYGLVLARTSVGSPWDQRKTPLP